MFTAAVIGGGVVGCHIALHLAERGYSVFLLEKNERLGQETSTRNSGVLHAGIYYPPGSLKATLCLEGNARSREFFERWEVPFRPTGKYIIARNADEEGELESLLVNARNNSVPGMEMVNPSRVHGHLPFIKCVSALYSGSTGILDAAEYMTVLYGLLYRYDVQIIRSCRVVGIDPERSVETERGSLEADLIINAAGLYADELARSCGVNEYTIIPLKGDYMVTKSIKIDIPVYPVPTHSHKTLGIHLTPTFSGETLIGPSEIPSSGKEDYRIETPRESFMESLGSMMDDSVLDGLVTDEGFAGNRPRVYRDGKRCEDFVIIRSHPGVFHLIGIESPGLTAAPAIAAHVYRMI